MICKEASVHSVKKQALTQTGPSLGIGKQSNSGLQKKLFQRPKTNESINGFFHEYRWLSNFWECPVTVGGLTYDSAEAAYQASKLPDGANRRIFLNISAKEAKKKGRSIEIRSDWERCKLFFMMLVLYAKFGKNPELREKLIATGDKHLEETNTWGDTYWGVCKGEGENHLGRLLMKIRSQLSQQVQL